VFLLTPLGRELLALPDAEGQRRTRELDREFRRNRPQRKRADGGTTQPARPATDTAAVTEDADVPGGPGPPDDEGLAAEDARWQDVLLARLHALTPDAFEEFVMYLLRLYGMELERVGQSGDRGIDGIGFAPINAVMSSRVAVQVKKYDPTSRAISREDVSLFQNDAKKRGAERAVFVTLGRYSKPARDEAVVGTPTVALIDGDRLAELVLEQRLGVELEPVVKPRWFDRFD
jgi:restriction system protein